MVFGYFSLSGGFLKLNAAFPVIFAVAGYAVKSFVTSPISDTVLASLDVPLAKVPALAAVSLVALAFLSVVPTILGLSMYQVYDNSNPRGTKSRENLKNYPTIHRMQNAHDNTLEFLALMAPCLWSASTLGLDELLFAKLMTLVFIAVRLAPVQQLSPAPTTLVIGARARSLCSRSAWFTCPVTGWTRTRCARPSSPSPSSPTWPSASRPFFPIRYCRCSSERPLTGGLRVHHLSCFLALCVQRRSPPPSFFLSDGFLTSKANASGA